MQSQYEQRSINLLFCPQTFIHTVMCKDLLNSLKYGIRCRILLNIWRVFGFPASLNWPDIFCLTRPTIYSPFTKPAKSGKLRLMSSLYKDTNIR